MRSHGACLLAGAAVLYGVAPAAAAPCTSRTPDDPAVPSWRAVAGFPLGSRPATPEQIDRYLQAVDAASARVRTYLAGRSVQGRPIRYAAVGTPANLARLGRISGELRSVRTGRASTRRAARIARTRPAFAWIAGSAHGNEPSGGDADMRLLYDAAAGRTCRDLARLRRLVVFLLPVQNPDGRASDRRSNARGFDLNRDWFARTQPETRATVGALTRFPPVVFADQHEEGGTGFFFPPNADPVHHEISRQALASINRIVGPRLRRAFARRGLPSRSGVTYDLFFMGYGDTVSTTLFGAAGMTFEKGSTSAYADRTAEHRLAADQTLRAVAGRRRPLLEAWAAQWRQARRQGARGALQPNRVLQPGGALRFPVPDSPVHGYVLRADRHGADAAALVRRLTSVGVEVLRLRAPVTAPGFRGYGERTAGPALLPAGTFVVPLAQAAKHWVQALLGEDPYPPFPYFYDVSGWSNPLLMGLLGGVLTAPLPTGASTASVPPAARPAAPAEAPAYAFAGDSQRAAELAFALLRAGLPVTRAADGTFSVSGDRATIVAAATSRRVKLAATAAGPGGPPLRLPRVGLFAGDPAEAASGWTRWLLETRYGLAVRTVTGNELAAGLSDLDVLVVPDGTSSASQLSPAALTGLQVWVRSGGSLVGWRSRGVAVARAAGVTAVETAPAPPALQTPGVVLRVALDPSDPVAAGERNEGFVFNDGDPLLDAGGAKVIARYPAGERFFASGYATGTENLEGRPVVTREAVGAGRVVLFAFDPTFRGYVEATQRLVGNTLLTPAEAGTTRRTAPRAIDPLAPAVPASHRDAVVQVPATDEAALLAAATEAGVPADRRVERDLSTVSLLIPNPRGLAAEQRPWTRRLTAALAAAGVAPLLVAF